MYHQIASRRPGLYTIAEEPVQVALTYENLDLYMSNDQLDNYIDMVYDSEDIVQEVWDLIEMSSLEILFDLETTYCDDLSDVQLIDNIMVCAFIHDPGVQVTPSASRDLDRFEAWETCYSELTSSETAVLERAETLERDNMLCNAWQLVHYDMPDWEITILENYCQYFY